tara:strand:- start:236 stop:994 length:759 start_codon:yes stop_codon:yes gene_type:complete
MIFTNLIQTNLRTKVFGNKIEYYQRLGSTNEEAWELIDSGEARHGMIIITDNQFSGKGRNKNQWYMSPSKGLAMSIIILEPLEIEKSFLIPLAGSIAVAKALKNRGFTPQLKWPNDILLNGKKCGGILCESRVLNKETNQMVIGIGLNINDQKDDLISEIQEKSTSLFIETGHPNQRELIAAIITTYFEQLFNDLSVVTDQWSEHCFHLNEEISFKHQNSVQKGIFKGIKSNGLASIQIDDEIINYPSIILE